MNILHITRSFSWWTQTWHINWFWEENFIVEIVRLWFKSVANRFSEFQLWSCERWLDTQRRTQIHFKIISHEYHKVRMVCQIGWQNARTGKTDWIFFGSVNIFKNNRFGRKTKNSQPLNWTEIGWFRLHSSTNIFHQNILFFRSWKSVFAVFRCSEIKSVVTISQPIFVKLVIFSVVAFCWLTGNSQHPKTLSKSQKNSQESQKNSQLFQKYSQLSQKKSQIESLRMLRVTC